MYWEDIAINDIDKTFNSTEYEVLEKYYGNIDYKSGFILLNQLNEVLLVHQSTGNTGFPKGSRDINDKSAFDTATRELFEETTISPCQYTVMPNIFHFHRKKCNELMMYFVAKLHDEASIIIDNNEIIGYSWSSISNLRNIKKKSVPTQRIFNILKNVNIKN